DLVDADERLLERQLALVADGRLGRDVLDPKTQLHAVADSLRGQADEQLHVRLLPNDPEIRLQLLDSMVARDPLDVRQLVRDERRDIQVRQIDHLFDPFVPRAHDLAVESDAGRSHEPSILLPRLDRSAPQLQPADADVDLLTDGRLDEAFTLLEPGIGAGPLDERPRSEHTELPPHLVLRRARAIGIQGVTFVQDRVGNLLGGGKSHRISLASASAHNASTAASHVGSARRVLKRASASKLSRARQIQAVPAKCASMAARQTETGRRIDASASHGTWEISKPPGTATNSVPLKRQVTGASPSCRPWKNLAAGTAKSNVHATGT